MWIYGYIEGMISLGGGMPHPHTFPFDAVAVRLKAGVDGQSGDDGVELRIAGAEMAQALQYSATVRACVIIGYCGYWI